MKFASLGSGSQGNATVVCSNATCVMFDCGFSLKETQSRLSRLKCDPATVNAVVVTHEHADHAAGAFLFARHYHIPVWMSAGTLRALSNKASDVDVRVCADSRDFDIGDLRISPYTISHDANEPLQFHMHDAHKKLGILTDTGQVTPHIQQALSDCHGLLMEFNHDEQMLAQSNYPYPLKQRILGPYGHLSNHQATAFVQQLTQPHLSAVVAVHLSRHNNTPDLAHDALSCAVNTDVTRIHVATQDDGVSWIEV